MAAWLLPLLLTAAGTGVSAYAQNQAAQRQQAAINRQYANQMEAKRGQNAALGDALGQYRPEERGQQYQQAQADSTQRLMDVMASTPAELRGVAASTAGNTGSDYDTAVANANAAANSKAQVLAGLLGRTGGQADLFRKEAGRMRQAENKGMLIGNQAMGQKWLDDAAIQKAEEVNPWLSMAGSAMQSFGVGRLGKNGSMDALGNKVDGWWDKAENYMTKNGW